MPVGRPLCRSAALPRQNDIKYIAHAAAERHSGRPTGINFEMLPKTVKSMSEHRQREYWDEVCEDIEKSIRNNDFVTAFSIIRRLKGGGKRDNNTPIQDKSGKVLVNPKDTLNRWRRFFHDTLDVTTSIDQNLIDQIQIPTLSVTEECRQNAPISIEEVTKTLEQMKLRKAPGSDKITADILKAGGEPVIQWLFKFFTEVWENEQMVEEWNMTIMKLYKIKVIGKYAITIEVSLY